jgi:predicted transcriptional regulator YdeE
MKTITQDRPQLIVGIELRTSNDEAFRTIPPHWRRFTEERVLERIPNRASDDVIAVYTHFEHEGIDNRGQYSLIIGAPVEGRPAVPEGMVSAVLPAGRRAVFPVEPARPDQVGAAWQRIWQREDLRKSHVADCERYGAHGEIEIHVGLDD